MPRAIWSGAISFGLVNIPVKLYTAVNRKSVRFNQIDARTGSRIKLKKVSSVDGTEVPSDHLARGYEVSKGSYVIVEDDELAALQPEAQRTVEIDRFVDLSEIDPVFYDSAYYLAPDRDAKKPYALLVAALSDAGKVALAHFVMRQRRYIATIRPRDGHLVMSTMMYADEIGDPAEVPELTDVAEVELTGRELEMARQLVDSLSEDWDPEAEDLRDSYREAVLELISRKASGEEVVVAPGAVEAEKVVDLMAALEASVAAAKEARKRHPTARPAGIRADAQPEPERAVGGRGA